MSTQPRLTNRPNHADWDQAWSPDGRWIVFSSGDSHTNVFDLYIVRADGSELIRLTDDSTSNVEPTWTPLR